MRIALVAPLIESVPPQRYGGTERVVSYLNEALIELGHDVTLYASGDSRTHASLVAVIPRNLRGDGREGAWPIWTTLMLERVFRDAERGAFDLIHFHVDMLHYPLARRCRTPCVTTLHGRQDLPGLAALYQHFADLPLVSISDSQREPLPHANWLATIHHGLPLNLYRYHPQAQNYFCFVGRISPEKRVDRAIEIAIGCNVPLKIAAKVDNADRAYFEQRIRPLLPHPLIEYLGEIGEEEKNDVIGNARALLFPIDWPEPFGLVAVEALACGTPVISYPCGAVPEILRHGIDSFIVHDQEQAISMARNIEQIARANCRASFEQRFSVATMAERYLDVYRTLIRRPADAVQEHWNGRQDPHRQQVVRRRHLGEERAESASPQE
ncbi:MAG TPA: glycosyltransferase family 4 protein [Burkholderiaceae bacterium]|nr:glycosyltransferase family 4 protein [Burkholderiaceae bacterium]